MMNLKEIHSALPHREARLTGLISLSALFAPIQFLAGLTVGVSYYLLAMAMTTYDGILSLIFQPLIAVLLTSLSLVPVWFLGLPIRLLSGLRTWWIKHWWIPFALGTIAFTMMCASWHPALRVQIWNPDLNSHQDSFHPILAFGGWLLTLFAVIHFYPPLNNLGRFLRALLS